MTATDLTRWNRAGLPRFVYVDGNAPVFLELLRAALASRFTENGDQPWEILHTAPLEEDERERLDRLVAQYAAGRQDLGWEIVRAFARACHMLTAHVDAYANEGFLGTATQWDNVRRMVEMLDYHPAPPASASTPLVLVPKDSARGVVAMGFQVKHAPASGPPIIYETLEDVTVEAALYELRPAGYDRNPTKLSGSVLTFAESVKHVKVGEPVVLEDEASGRLHACLVHGVLEQDGQTRITVLGGVGTGFTAGHTIVHAQPMDRLALRDPIVTTLELRDRITLAEPPSTLRARDIVHISDGATVCYRRVTRLEERVVVLERTAVSRPIDPLVVRQTILAPAEAIPGSAIQEPVSGFHVRVPGDRSDLQNALVAALCDPGRGNTIVEYTVVEALFIDQKATTNREEIHPDGGYTLLKLNSRPPCTRPGIKTLWVPPVGGGWRADQQLNLETFTPLVTDKPKKLAAGDIAVVTSGNLIAYAALGSVEPDLAAGEARVTPRVKWTLPGSGVFYLSDTVLHGHFKQKLRVAGWQENRTPLTGNAVRLGSAPAALRKGTRLLVECPGSHSLVTTVSRVQSATVTLADRLPRFAWAGGLVLRGNVVTAGQGESKPEKVLGSGSAAASNQAFTLEVPEVSFIADPTMATGVRADIAVRVAGREWKQVATLNDSGPADAHYVVRMTEDGFVVIRFGDGVNGQRLPTGTNNVRVAFRKGTGLRGNLPPGSLTKPVKPHALIAATLQPLAATGGNDMEGIASLRTNAPASVLTIERAVSVEDFGHLAASHSSVWQARSFSRPSGRAQRELIEVIVVPANGGPLGDLGGILADFLLAHALPGVAVTVTNYTGTSFAAEVELTVDEAAYVPDEVRLEVEQRLRSTFSLQRRGLGQDVYLSEVYQVVENTTGVIHSQIVLNGDRTLRRLMTDERSVRVLGALTLRVAGETTSTGSAEGGASSESAPAFAELPVGARSSTLVDGVGVTYGARLAAAGITTIRALATADPDLLTLDIPRPQLWEVVAKAQGLLQPGIDPDAAAVLLDRPLAEVGSMTHAALAELTGESPERVTALRTSVRRLQMSLDDEGFRSIRLREFVTS